MLSIIALEDLVSQYVSRCKIKESSSLINLKNAGILQH
jgi:hypothetical protein